MVEYHRKYFGLKKEVTPVLEATYASKIVDLLRLKGFRITIGNITIKLAREFGFCVGVERAVQMAYETRRKYPDKRIFITTEIIHNAFVNKQLTEMGIIFLNGQYASATMEDIGKDDVVILPAFGASVEEIERIKGRGAFIVDSTCGAVVTVWNNVHKNARDNYTSIIHGKYGHEETIATASRATGKSDGFTAQDVGRKGKYLIVRDLDEAKIVCDYILNGGDRAAFLKRFEKAISEGFDPDVDLDSLGVANQTTMLSSETFAIQGSLRAVFVQKFGEEVTRRKFQVIDTICSATQDRQDAMAELLDQSAHTDLMIVIGGYNSSNTSHLAEMGIEKKIPSFHIDDASCMLSKSQIRHQPVEHHEEVITDWWPDKERIFIGVTAGASTPNNKIGDVFLRIFEINGLNTDALIAEIEALPDVVLEEGDSEAKEH